MSKAQKKPAAKKKGPRFPWLLLLILLGTVYLFWVYPLQRGPAPVQVVFEGATRD